MSQKQGSSKKARKTKVALGQHGGGGKVRLTELQKVLIVNGGQAHFLRKGQTRVPAEKTAKGRRFIEEAEAAKARKFADEQKIKRRQKATQELKGSIKQ